MVVWVFGFSFYIVVNKNKEISDLQCKLEKRKEIRLSQIIEMLDSYKLNLVRLQEYEKAQYIRNAVEDLNKFNNKKSENPQRVEYSITSYYVKDKS